MCLGLYHISQAVTVDIASLNKQAHLQAGYVKSTTELALPNILYKQIKYIAYLYLDSAHRIGMWLIICRVKRLIC